MPKTPLTIWCNSRLPEPAMTLLRDGTREHRLLISKLLKTSNLVGGAADALLEQADVALGQPDPQQVISSQRLRWVQLDSAGYTRYDRDDVRSALRARGATLTNGSSVYDEPCAQHVLGMMLAFARQLPQSLLDQHATRGWRSAEIRTRCDLLGPDQTVLLLGFGAISRRLAELLRPFAVKVIATRRSPRGDEPVPVFSDEQTDGLLGQADHVVNVLPDNPSTAGFITSERFARMKPTAFFYNIGRGTTVRQDALIAALFNKQIAGAYLDVTEPEPLPPDHLLWRAPNCYITPHTGGGHHDEFERMVQHFLANLERFERGEQMSDRVI